MDQRVRFLGSFVILVLVTAVGTPGYSGPAGTQIVVAQGSDVVTPDPRRLDSGIDMSVVFQMCDPLVNYDKNWNIVPALATSWKAVTPTTYEFSLRQGVKFQDGTPVTAADVKATMDRILDPTFKSAEGLDFVNLVKSTEVVDPTTVRFNLTAPYAAFVAQLPYVFPVSQQAVQKLGDQDFAHHPVCAGPYQLVEWVPDDHLTLQASADYWGGRPKVDRLVFKPIPDAATRASALRAGEVDLATNLSPDQLPAVERDPKLRILATETGRMEFFLLNTKAKPFSDKRVRQAVNYAIDWAAIMKSIMGGYGHRAPAPAMSYMFGYKEVKGYPYDPARAKQLLTEAGYPNGFNLTIETPSGRYFVDKDIAQAVTGFLRRVGINANLQANEWSQHVALERKGLWEMGLWGFVSLYHEFNDVGIHFEPSRGAAFYSNPDVVKLFEEGRTVLDPARRRAIYSRATDLIVDDAPWLFGVAVVGTFGANRRLGWEPRSGTDILFDLNKAALQ